MISASKVMTKVASKGTIDPHLRLAAGILANAASQAKNEANVEAVAWLLDEDCQGVYCFLLDVDSEAVRQFAQQIDLARAGGD